jgi:hypothetical protein
MELYIVSMWIKKNQVIYFQTLNVDVDRTKSLSQEELLHQTVYIPFRGLKDPREIRMLDPACGSMHFGLYAFDLYDKIYQEAWQLETELGENSFERSDNLQPLHLSYASFEEFKSAIPKLIIEYNIHGVDIDPRAVQIAGLSLWQRAQKSWQQMEIKPDQRPSIKKSNIVCAEPMPGEKEMLNEFTAQLNPPILGQLVETIFEKMELAGEAGTLLKIEEEISTVIDKAKEEFDKEILRRKEEEGYLPGMAPIYQPTLFDFAELQKNTDFWNQAEERILKALSEYSDQAETSNGLKRLFAEDASRGFALIDLCRKRYDAILMNPPFGDSSKNIKKYIENTYPFSKNNILACFIERGAELLTDNGRSGSIVSRAAYYLSTLSDFREKILLKGKSIDLHIDLGSKVLDAMVEVACNIFTKIQNNKSNTQFVRLLISEEKREALIKAINNLNVSKITSNTFTIPQTQLNFFQGCPFVYWIPTSVAQKLSQLPSIEPKYANIRVGLQTGTDFRFLRTWWEVPSENIINSPRNSNTEEIQKHSILSSMSKNTWAFYSKIDKASPFVAPIHLVVNWGGTGREIKSYHEGNGHSASKYVMSEGKYFLPGISYMLRSTRLVPYVVPRGVIPAAGRSQIYPKHGFENIVLSIISSNLASAVARFRGENFGGPKFQNSMVGAIPYSEIKPDSISIITKHIADTSKELLNDYGSDETSIYFIGTGGRNNNSTKLDRRTFLGDENELRVAVDYGLTKTDLCSLELDLMECIQVPKWMSINNLEENDTEIDDNHSENIMSWAVGVVFGRFSIERVFNKETSLEIIDPFSALPNKSLCMLNNNETFYHKNDGILVDDPYSKHDIVSIIEKVLNEIAIQPTIPLRKWLQNKYFSIHLKNYTKSRRQAPIYHPLQTTSGSYTLWVYYHRLTEQTLYSCINDFVEPKLKNIADELNNLRSKSSRSSSEEKEFSKLFDLEFELKDFRDELTRIAKFWKPNLNDGVQITAAPLWKLFQHKPWQKKLKQTWEILEKGEYDWAHLACSIWPERVLKKCHKDRSLAIAHDVESDFWVEEEVAIVRRGKDTGDTKTDWQPRKLSETELKDLIQKKMAEMK